MPRQGNKKRKDGHLDFAPAFRETVHVDGVGGTAATPEDELQTFLESMYTPEMVQAAGLVASIREVAAVDRGTLRVRGFKSVGDLRKLYEKESGGGSALRKIGLDETGLPPSVVDKIREAFEQGLPMKATFEFKCYVNLPNAESVVIPVPTGFNVGHVAEKDRDKLVVNGFESVEDLHAFHRDETLETFKMELKTMGLRELSVAKIVKAFTYPPTRGEGAAGPVPSNEDLLLEFLRSIYTPEMDFTDECVEDQFDVFASEFDFIEDDQPDVVLWVRANGLYFPFLQFSCMVPGRGATGEVRWTTYQRAEWAADPEKLKTVVKDSLKHMKVNLADPRTDRPPTGEGGFFNDLNDLCRPPLKLRKHLPTVSAHARENHRHQRETVDAYTKLNKTLLAINTSERLGERMCEVLCMRLKGIHAKIKAAVDAKLVERLKELSYTKICEIGGVPPDGGGGAAAAQWMEEEYWKNDIQVFLASIYTFEMMKAAGLVEKYRGFGVARLVEEDSHKLNVDKIMSVKDLRDLYESPLSAEDRTIFMKAQLEDLEFNDHAAAKIIEALEERGGAAGGDGGVEASFEYVKTLAEFGTIHREWELLDERDRIVDEERFAGDSSMLPSRLIIPANVQLIGINAFGHCPELRSVEMLDLVDQVDEFAFFGCENLKHVFFPLSVLYICDSAFKGCSALTSVSVPPFAVFERTAFPATCTIWRDGVIIHPAIEEETDNDDGDDDDDVDVED